MILSAAARPVSWPAPAREPGRTSGAVLMEQKELSVTAEEIREAQTHGLPDSPPSGGNPPGSVPGRSGGPPPGPGDPAGNILPMAALMSLIIGAFMAILDGSIVNVALPKMMTIFGVTPDEIQWVMTAYLLASGVIVPVTGYLGDRYGMKRLYIFSLGAFTLGSALCGMAWSNNSLITARVIQAIGGGMIMPVSMSMIYRIVPRDKIGTALGIWGIAAMAAPAVGPTLGGYLVDNFSWQLLFTINIPIGIAASFFAGFSLNETPRRDNLRPDIPGIILSAAACFALLLALSEGQDKGWTSLYIVNLFILSGFTLAGFILWELFTPEPLLDIRFLKNKTFSISLACVGITTIGLFTGIFLIPLFAQSIQGYTPMQTGLLMMPMAIATGLLMPVSGRLFDKIGALPLGFAGLTIAAITTWQLHTITYDISMHKLQWLLVERAVGLGLCMMPLNTAGMNTIPPFLIARASAMSNLIRQVASSFGIAFMTYVMLHRQDYHAACLAETVNPGSPAAVGALQQLQGLLSQAGLGSQGAYSGALSIISALVKREAYIAGIADAFVISTIIIVAAIPLVFFLGKKQVEAQRIVELKRYKHMMPPGSGAPPQGGAPGEILAAGSGRNGGASEGTSKSMPSFLET